MPLRVHGCRIAAGLLLAAVAFCCSCRERPGEPVFVISLEGGTGPEPERVVVDSLQTASADTLPVPDSIPEDTVSLPVAPRFESLEGSRVLAVEIRGSLYETLQQACAGQEPDVLGAHFTRCLWWHIDPWRGICAGDSIIAVYRDEGFGMENRTVALRYAPVSGSSNRPFAVYQFKRTGDNYPSYWRADGTEAVRLLDVMPVSTFEEITGVFGEPRGGHSHGGLDFKAPEGTPVRTPHGGRVIRMDWNTGYNGRCIELDIGGGYSEIHLHLQGIAPGLYAGSSAEQGSVIGWVGNTGRSYSAHLHYQINDENGYPIDPLIFSGSHTRTLPQADLDGFAQFRAACDSLIGAP